MKRFYERAESAERDGRYAILLDGKPIRTPLKAVLSVETPALAEAIAGEWNAQGEHILPATMKLTQLANTTLDRIGPARPAVMEDTLQYLDTDLVCYRAEEPPDLCAAQSQAFDPALEWFEARTGIALVVARGLMPVTQPTDAAERTRPVLDTLTDAQLTVLTLAAGLSASLVLALVFVAGEIDANALYRATNVDELYQIRSWGEDMEATARLAAVRAEYEMMGRYLELTTKTCHPEERSDEGSS